jgi:3-oxoacyl-[acyl-carrier-protein] synthase II
MKDVYIVDYAVIDTIGSDIEDNYKNLKNLATGPQTITRYDTTKYSNVFCTKGYELKKYDSYNLYPRLVNDLVDVLAKKVTIPSEAATIVGSFAASGNEIRSDFLKAFDTGVTRFSPTKLFLNNHDLVSGTISKKLKLENFSTSTLAACSTSMFNLHYAATCIQSDVISCAIVGAVETPLHPTFQYYWQCTSAISTMDGGICKPFDKKRDGFVQAEGGSLWFICDEETLKKYNLTPKAKLLSISASAKCFDSATMTAHDKTGKNQIDTINKALKLANKTPEDMAFFNAHATSTLIGDDIEFDVFQKVFKDIDIPCVSLKGYLGHTMSACGMIETTYGIEALKNGYIHPNYDLTDPISDDARLITKTTPIKKDTFMKASFGFGGRTVIAIVQNL